MTTRVYFVRHAQPEHMWEDDRTRPLTLEGKKDSAIVLDFLKDKDIHVFYCSPYQRSLDTIADSAALSEILAKHKGQNIVIGTHGTALSSILNYYYPEFGCKDFLRIIDWMPYVIELDFEEDKLLLQKEQCHIEKEFKGKERADKVQK